MNEFHAPRWMAGTARMEKGNEMTDLEAIMAASSGQLFSPHDGGLWSNRHMIVRHPFPEGREPFEELGAFWDRIAARTGEGKAEIDGCFRDSRAAAYRRLAGPYDVYINEAYRQTVQADGIDAFVAGKKAEIAFRDAERRLVAVVAPIGHQFLDPTPEPTQELVWWPFACRDNGWHKVSTASALRRLLDAKKEAVAERREAYDAIKGQRAIVAECTADIKRLDADIAALNFARKEAK